MTADGSTPFAEIAEVCRCDCAYVGTQPAGTPTRCERCRGLVDAVAQERMDAVYAEARRGLEERAATRADATLSPGSGTS